jgi:RNase P subunit RPR2
MATLLGTRPSARPKRFYQRGRVTCQKCAAPIYVYKFTALPDEISVRCNKCGARGIYAARAIVVEEVPERRKKPRK